MMTNVGKWDRIYSLVGTDPTPYGSTETYELGAAFLRNCALIEDWGCGTGWFRTLVAPDQYRGIDGSASPFTDLQVDLTTYRSRVPGVFMRHVLEHNYEWRSILANAVASFTERMVLILFTPLAETTQQIAFTDDPGVPDLSFALVDIVGEFGDAKWAMEQLPTDTQYGIETVFYLERP